MEIALKKIVVGERCRKDMGDMERLKESIERLGLLQPILVLVQENKYQLIAGYRRYLACSQLGMEKIKAICSANVVTALECLQAERDENTCRKDFTPEEAVYAAKTIEEVAREEARQRQQEGRQRAAQATNEKRWGEGNEDKQNEDEEEFENWCNKRSKYGAQFRMEDFPAEESLPAKLAGSDSSGDSRDRIAKAVGMGHTTYEKARAVVAARDAEPEKYQPLVDHMNKKGVDGAFRKLQEMQAEGQRSGEDESGTSKLPDGDDTDDEAESSDPVSDDEAASMREEAADFAQRPFSEQLELCWSAWHSWDDRAKADFLRPIRREALRLMQRDEGVTNYD